MADAGKAYLPAAGHDWALPLYDPFVKLLGGEPTRLALIEQAAIRPHHRILEIGCGTGSVLVLLKRTHPDAEVVGLDPDPKALRRAKRKAERASVSIGLDQGFSGDMHYPDRSFDRVLSSFMFHHLDAVEKERTLREVRRVLKPDGVFHMVDFAGLDARSGGFLARRLHAHHRLADNDEDRILALMRQAGFADVRKVREGTIFFGYMRLKYYQASVPDAEPHLLGGKAGENADEVKEPHESRERRAEAVEQGLH
jgi:SAM-dependent methyltransferase